MKYVIIGNSAAAVGCVEGIRQADRAGSITIISAEPHHTYSRPLISYLLCGKTDETRMRYRGPDFYESNGVTAMLGVTVRSIDPPGKQVLLGDGGAVPYDKLLVSAGSSPFVPPIAGLDTVPHRYTFMTLDDARALDDAVTADTRVLILGAGLIGLKCAEGLRKRTGRITVMDLADRILPSILDAEAAGMVAAHITAQGVTLRLSDSVERFEQNRATLKSGGVLEFDLLVVAVGVRPNTALVREAGGAADRGVVTDRLCRTSLPDVYAAGDCAKSHDITTGEDRVLALLPNAYAQGECAGLHMAGVEKPWDKAIPMNAIGFFGLHIITAGSYDGQSYTAAGEGSYKRLVYKDNLLKGYILVGEILRAGIYTALIRERTPLDTVDFSLIKEKPGLMAFTRKERAKKLGGATV